MKIVGDSCHLSLMNKITPKLSFDENKNYDSWKLSIKEKLWELLGMDSIAANACEANFQIEEDVMMEDYRRIRFVFESEIDSFVPCYLLIPNTGKTKYPVAITLQGHSTGFHNSIGVPQSDHDKEYIETRGDFGVQSVKNGYATLCIEQRAMGERKTSRDKFESRMCTFPTMTALMLGRTTLGERIWDVQRAIDVLYNFEILDLDKILITGNSGGGTMSYYASCLEDRIKISAPSCAFCSYETSIMSISHCPCNYIPSAYNWFEMQDLACLIAPKKLLIFAGKEDTIFPIDGVKKGFETVQKIYEKAGVKDDCKLVVTEKGHWWCKDLVWQEINKLTDSLNWRN